MRYWDSSAVVALLFDEPTHRAVVQLREADPEMVVWWGTPIEVLSAAARRKHGGRLAAADERRFIQSFETLAEEWKEVALQPVLRDTARRLLWAHPLRAADALQLAAALVAAEEEPSALDFVCLDARLAAAARREGFPVLP